MSALWMRLRFVLGLVCETPSRVSADQEAQGERDDRPDEAEVATQNEQRNAAQQADHDHHGEQDVDEVHLVEHPGQYAPPLDLVDLANDRNLSHLVIPSAGISARSLTWLRQKSARSGIRSPAVQRCATHSGLI